MLTARGYGKGDPLVSNETPENSTQIRRVAFLVTNGLPSVNAVSPLWAACYRISGSGCGSVLRRSSLNSAPMWKKAITARVSERFSHAWSVPR